MSGAVLNMLPSSASQIPPSQSRIILDYRVQSNLTALLCVSPKQKQNKPNKKPDTPVFVASVFFLAHNTLL